MRLLTRIRDLVQSLLPSQMADHGDWQNCRNCAERWRASGYKNVYCPRHQKR